MTVFDAHGQAITVGSKVRSLQRTVGGNDKWYDKPGRAIGVVVLVNPAFIRIKEEGRTSTRRPHRVAVAA